MQPLPQLQCGLDVVATGGNAGRCILSDLVWHHFYGQLERELYRTISRDISVDG